MNGVGQPCEGELHARLDEEGLETEQPPPRQPFTRQLRNVTDRVPDALASTVAKRMRRAYHHPDALVAQAELEALARELDRSHPRAAASLREGLAETLTVIRLGVPPTLARTLRSTDERFKALWRCPPVLAWLASALGVADPEAKSRAVGLEALPRSFAP